MDYPRSRPRLGRVILPGRYSRSLAKGELGELLTSGGKPKAGGPLGRALAHRESVTSDFAAAQARLDQADEHITRFAQLTSERSIVADPAEVANIKSELHEAEDALKKANQARFDLSNTELKERQATIVGIAMLTSKGASGVTGAGFVTLAATLAIVPDIPIASLGVLLGVDRFMSLGRSLTNLVGNGVATLVVARWERELSADTLRSALSDVSGASV